MELIKTAIYGSLTATVTFKINIPKPEIGCQSPFFIKHCQIRAVSIKAHPMISTGWLLMSTPSVEYVLPMCVTDEIDQHLAQNTQKSSVKTDGYTWFWWRCRETMHRTHHALEITGIKIFNSIRAISSLCMFFVPYFSL
jgi:hypothetical protein